MEGGDYLVKISFIALVTPPDTEHAPAMSARLTTFLPRGRVLDARTDPATKQVWLTIKINGESPGAALIDIQKGIEYLGEEVRRDHGLHPLAPMPTLVEACITHA